MPAMNKQFTIPTPLEADQPIRWSTDGTIRFYNPDWHKKISELINAEFIDTVISSIVTDEKQMDSEKVTCSSCVSRYILTQPWLAASVHLTIPSGEEGRCTLILQEYNEPVQGSRRSRQVRPAHCHQGWRSETGKKETGSSARS